MGFPDLGSLCVNPDWARLPLFDRSKWQRVRFGDVVENLNETCDPREARIERYIGLEHLEPGSLHIRSWGNVADGTTFTRYARPGQVLFGKRRAYQRKVAVTSFDAVVSGDIYVLASKGDRLLGELLPFLCVSERFFNHAVGTSAGSLSPRTNWTNLAGFEFDLPPLEHQRRILRLLLGLDEGIEAAMRCAIAARDLHRSRLISLFNNAKRQWPMRPLEQVARVERGKFSHRPRNLPEFYGGQHPFVQTGDVQRADRYLKNFEYALTDLGATHSKLFPAKTVFVTIAAVIGATAISDRETYVTDSVVGVVPSEDMDVEYIELFLRSKRVYFETQVATQTAQKNINLQVLRPLKIPCPPKREQSRMAGHVLEPLTVAEALDLSATEAREVMHRLVDLLI